MCRSGNYWHAVTDLVWLLRATVYAVGDTPAAIVSHVCWRLLIGHAGYRTGIVDAWARYASSCSWLRPRLLRLIPRGWCAVCTLLD